MGPRSEESYPFPATPTYERMFRAFVGASKAPEADLSFPLCSWEIGISKLDSLRLDGVVLSMTGPTRPDPIAHRFLHLFTGIDRTHTGKPISIIWWNDPEKLFGRPGYVRSVSPVEPVGAITFLHWKSFGLFLRTSRNWLRVHREFDLIGSVVDYAIKNNTLQQKDLANAGLYALCQRAGPYTGPLLDLSRHTRLPSA